MLKDTTPIHTDFHAFNTLRKDARENSPDAIKKVAKQFESLFVQMMLKSMRDTVPESELFGSQSERMYQDMYDKQISLHISNGKGVGLANVIERQLGGKPDYELNAKSMEDYFSSPRSNPSLEKSSVTLSSLSPYEKIKASVQSLQSEKIKGAWENPQAFISDVWPHALRAADELGVDADVLMAQSALETGWGKYLPLKADGSNSFNLFGIKADSRWQGDKVEITTREFRHGVMQHEKAAFRAYDSVSDALDDYVKFIGENPRYQKALEHGYDAKAYARELQNAGYATDPDYAKKINRVRASEQLQNKVSELKNLNQAPLT